MIEIIKLGTKKMRICSMCGCKFTYEKEDIKQENLDNYKGFREFVQCPQCCENVILRQTR